MKKGHLIGIVSIVALAAITLVVVWPNMVESPSRPLFPTNDNEVAVEPEVIASDLAIPWEVVFLPGGDMLITERGGQLLRIGAGNQKIPIQGVAHTGEGGLLGLALHPNFATNNFIYLYLTTRTDSGLTNRVERYKLSGTEVTDRVIIIENIPGASFHDGGRIAFGPDNLLYIATGDAGNEDSAQDQTSLAGKILRLQDDGTIPSNNPFNSAVYSLGHRNVQGLAWDADGQLWATEHGRSGLLSGFDEVNRIQPGKNYGWPLLQGDEEDSGFEAPKAHSGPRTTWAPSGAAFIGNSFFFAGLRGATLYEARIENNEVVEVIEHLTDTFGRLRTVVQGPDGALYILTNNTDGRGNPAANDDKLIRIDPAGL